jgi:heterotetrameric sarcosine oxidase delta subunit
MRIVCPHCGERPVDEFVSHGAAGLKRPNASASMSDWVDYVYLRDNIAGAHRELFYHVGGCRAWLIVTRDTRTHAIAGVVTARDQRDAAR